MTDVEIHKISRPASFGNKTKLNKYSGELTQHKVRIVPQPFILSRSYRSFGRFTTLWCRS
ncbi:hypothetical protein BDM02DRAFT_3106886 [Thelephora ganbajun]|uniref:Uncharacterized protein n=1 Tax=Thelephora ganbajun TaxID=370292 RepID=A0ACB6ZWH9_THEGA|nr:hypothetical protein BDM02DRAFT_3106886 [Thelephora ganbajun]